MKYLSRLLAGALLVSLTACSSDEPTAPGGETTEPGEPFYSTITFKMPTTPRSGLENPGDEVGQESENKVNAILVVLATKEQTAADAQENFKFVTCAVSDASIQNGKYTITFQDRDKLLAHAGEEVYIFAYCNPTPELRNKIVGSPAGAGTYTGGLAEGADFMDLICGAATAGDGASISDTWAENGFLMTSVGKHVVFLGDEDEKGSGMPEKEDEQKIYRAKHDAYLKTFNKTTKAFPLTKDKSIEVVRTASRFDIRDASPANTDAFTYNIYKDGVEYWAEGYTEKPEDIMTSVTFTRVALFNVRNEFYYLPRANAEGTEGANVNYCPGAVGMLYLPDKNDVFVPSFIISPATATFTSQINGKLNPLDKNPGDLTWEVLANLKTPNNENGWNADNKEYKIWTYATENTFLKNTSTTDLLQNENNITGAAFEAKINVDATENKIEKEDGTTEYKSMYLYYKTLYKNLEDMKAAVDEKPTSELAQRFNQCFEVKDDGSIVSKLSGDDTIDNYGFTEYKANANGEYLCYYFYYNRHVEDNKAEEVGDMEFGTVRNNIYKLGVTKVNSLGVFEPTDPTKWDVYFTLNVELKNWVVRVNDGIEF